MCAPSDSTATAGGTLDHIIFVALENHTRDEILGPGTEAITPFLHRVAAECGAVANFFDTTQPSLPNYIDVFAGQHPDYMDKVTGSQITGEENCTAYLILDDPQKRPCYSADANLFSQLGPGNWMSYAEGMGEKCRSNDRLSGYVVRHYPVVYFSNLAAGPTDCMAPANRPLPALDDAFLTSIDVSRKLTYILPNLCHGQHSLQPWSHDPGGCDLQPVPQAVTGADGNLYTYDAEYPDGCWGSSGSDDTCQLERSDQFLADLIPRLMGSGEYQAGRTAIIIWWDEDGVGSVGDTQVPLFVISPFTRLTDGVLPESPLVQHFDLLYTMQLLLGVEPLADNAHTAYGWAAETPPQLTVPAPGPGSAGRTDLRPYFSLH
ncbi:MAG: phosphatidylinositol-3-phosphatase [Gaiellales bacterium]|nr:phosphatidylinositol-3-phosphatase [Gaiellales bacterium]